MKLLSLPRSIALTWWQFVGDPDKHLEGAILIFTAPRVLLFLPWLQSRFAVSVGQFTSLVPQWVWALFALLICVQIHRALLRPFFHRPRANAMYLAGLHWLVLAGLLIMGDPSALAGWYYLAVCVLPLAAICRLSPPNPKKTSKTTISNTGHSPLKS